MSDHELALELRYLARSGWVKAKDVLGLPRRGDRTFYIDQFARRLARGEFASGRIAITVAGRTDGAGAQALAVMSGLCFARAFGLPYVHTPFVAVDHPEGPMEEWVRAWEDLFNFAASADSSFDAPVVFLGDFLRDRRAGERKCVVAMPHYQRWCNHNTDVYAAVAPALRRHYRPSGRRLHGDEIVVAVHVRRGDVSQHSRPDGYTPNGDVVSIIANISRVLRGQDAPFVVKVFSQGRIEDFADIAALGCEMRLNEPALATHRNLVEADVLVMAKSAFSYSAAIVNEGVLIYEPYRQTRPLPGWIVREPGGSFDEGELRSKIGFLHTRGRIDDGAAQPFR